MGRVVKGPRFPVAWDLIRSEPIKMVGSRAQAVQKGKLRPREEKQFAGDTFEAGCDQVSPIPVVGSS